MAYIGHGKINPNHPFAHLQIGFGLKPPPSLSRASQTLKTEPPAATEASSTSESPLAPAADSTLGARRSEYSNRSAGG